MTELELTYHTLLFAVRRSIRYHTRRRRFFDGRYRVTTAVAIILGSTSVVTVLTQLNPVYPAIASAIITVLLTLDLVAGTTAMSRLHHDLAREFGSLEEQLILMKEPSDDALRELTAARLKIEAKEPPVFRILDLLCHNEVVLALGYEEGELYHIPLYKRLVAHLIPFGDQSIRKYRGTPHAT